MSSCITSSASQDIGGSHGGTETAVLDRWRWIHGSAPTVGDRGTVPPGWEWVQNMAPHPWLLAACRHHHISFYCDIYPWLYGGGGGLCCRKCIKASMSIVVHIKDFKTIPNQYTVNISIAPPPPPPTRRITVNCPVELQPILLETYARLFWKIMPDSPVELRSGLLEHYGRFSCRITVGSPGE